MPLYVFTGSVRTPETTTSSLKPHQRVDEGCPRRPAWRERTLGLDAYARREVRLCVEIDGPGPSSGGSRFSWWAQPLIAVRGKEQKAEGDADDDAKAPGDLTPEELEVRRKHLKALGYVN